MTKSRRPDSARSQAARAREQRDDDSPATERRTPGFHTQLGNHTLRSWNVGALPLLNRILERLRLDELFRRHLPADDPRLEVPTAAGLLVLLRNLLISR